MWLAILVPAAWLCNFRNEAKKNMVLTYGYAHTTSLRPLCHLL